MEIMKRIEELRRELNKLGTDKSLQDPDVLRLSQILDELISRYYEMIQEKNQESMAS